VTPSPLPPEPAASLDLVNGKLSHLITVAEVTAQRVQRLEDEQERTRATERTLRRLVERTSGAALQLSAALALKTVLPGARTLVLTTAGAFAGGLVGTLLWQALHVGASLAAAR
jgi:hypothetical protein